MPFFVEGQDPRDAASGGAIRAPLGAPQPDPFAAPPSFNDQVGAAFRLSNPIVSVLDAYLDQSGDNRVDPGHNPMALAKGTPFEQDIGPLVDSPNEATTRAIIAHRQAVDADREAYARSGLPGTVAGLAAGFVDPSYYLPIFGELHAAQGLTFGMRALRSAGTGAAQSMISEAALSAAQGRRFSEGAGNIATNTLLMGLLGGALGHLAPAERAEANEALEGVRRDMTPVNPADPAAPSVAEVVPRRGQVFFPGGAIDARYALAEHSDLVTSHDADFNVNPDYPAELQPRDRSGAPAQDQVNTIAGNLEPERLGPSPEANAGAPIVGPDGVIESGNGRVLAIGKAYDSGRGEAYRSWLEQQGYDTSGYDKPVLVGLRETPMDPNQRAGFAHAANGSAALRMSATEQALSDARHVDSSVLDMARTPDLAAASNRDFAKSFVGKLPPGERGGLLTRDGSLSANGVRRASAALAARAYGDPAFLSRALDHPDPNIKAIAGAMSDAAGPWARMRDAATRGDIAPGHDITADVLQAVHAIMRARDEGRPAWEMLNQGDIFQSDTTQLASRMFFRNEAMRQPAGRARVAENLRGYAEEAAKNTNVNRLFDDAVSPGDVLRRVATMTAEKLGGLFDTAAQDVLAMVRAYHGSPHDFERFDASRIGEGEGNQHYGHGLYFAENEDVARAYRDALSEPFYESGGRRLDADAMSESERLALDRYVRAGHDIDKALEISDQQRAFLSAAGLAEEEQIARALRTWKDQGIALREGGHVYHVAIDREPEHFLDWDKPIAEQSPAIQKIARDAGMDIDKEVGHGLAWLEAAMGMDSQTHAPNGGDLYRHLMGEGTWMSDPENVAAAKHLADRGLAGIRYLDQKSRIAGAGTRNVVVFNDKDITVTHKNGAPVTSAERDDVLANMRRQRDEAAPRGRPVSATEPGAEPQPDLTLRNPRTGQERQAQSVASLGDALKQFDVSRNAGVDILTRASSLAMGDRLSRLIGDMKVYTVGPAEMRALAQGRIRMQDGFETAGFYDRTAGHIVVLDNAMRNPREATSLLLHEGLHGAFMATIENSEAATKVIDHLRETATAAHLSRGGDAADHYGLRNAHEFVSEAFSNSEFQRFLASVPADERIVQAFGLDKAPGNSLWDVFVAAVRKILGLAPDQHTLLDASLRLGDLLEQRRAELQSGAGDVAPMLSQRVGHYSYESDALPSARPAGAAPVDVRDLILKSFGLDKVPGLRTVNAKLSPNLRIYSGLSVQAKRAAASLADTALRFTQHDRGVPTAEGGSLESAVRVDKARYQLAGHDAVERAYVDHRYGGNKPSAFRRAADATADLRGQTPEGKLNYKDFKTAVYDAMYSGDQHPIREVAQAAAELRRSVFDPVKRMAQETLGPNGRPMLGEELSPPKGDRSFVPRAWNHQAVIAKRYQLKTIISDWLEREQGTKAAARDRIDGFVSDLTASKDRLAGLAEHDPARAREQATHDAIRAKIEKELGDWQGSSAAEAKMALKARGEAETRRQSNDGTIRGASSRLTSADDAVDKATRRILASDRDLSRAELEDRADEIIDRIIGSPDGRIPYDAASGGPRIGFTGGPVNQVRGSLKARDFAIPTDLVKDFVHRDMEHVVSSFLRTMLPDIYLTQRFGDVDMTDAFRRVQEEYARMVGPETTEAQAKALHARRDSDIADLATLRDRLRGVHGWNPDPSARKIAAVVRDFHAVTSMASLGTSVANRLNDIGAQAVMRYGIENVFRDAWRPFFKSMLGMSPLAGEAKRQAREMGVGVQGLLGHLRHNLSDINENYLPGNKFSRGLAWANDRSMLVNLHGPWTDWMQAMAWTPAQAELGRLADRVTSGQAASEDLSRLADANISPAMAARLSEQLAAHSITVDGVRLASAGEWTDRGARDAFERAMSREANIAVINAGIGQKPTFLTKPIGGLIGQFKSFVAGAHESILLSNLQQRDGRTMQGALVAMTMGMLSYRLYTLLAGQEASPRPQDWIKEGLARSALTGWFNEANNTLAKFTAGRFDYNRLYGADRPLTRRTENSPLSELLGPTYAKLEGLAGIGVHVLGGHGSAADVHKGRQILPLQNLMGFRIGLDDLEDGLSRSFGWKPRDHSPHDWPQ